MGSVAVGVKVFVGRGVQVLLGVLVGRGVFVLVGVLEGVPLVSVIAGVGVPMIVETIRVLVMGDLVVGLVGEGLGNSVELSALRVFAEVAVGPTPAVDVVDMQPEIISAKITSRNSPLSAFVQLFIANHSETREYFWMVS